MIAWAARLAIGCAAMLLAAALETARAAEEPAAIEDFTDVSLSELGIEWVAEKKDAEAGFIVAGRNSTATIRALTALGGRPIEELEREMRPGAASTQGFLGREEKLLDVLAADNQYVVDQRRLTHPQLARALRALAAAGLKRPGQEFLYHGRRYSVSFRFYRGYQDSPFRDGTKANSEAVVRNLTNGKTLEFSLLVPDMIERYGFYEGRGTPYRVEPREILALCDFLAEETVPETRR